MVEAPKLTIKLESTTIYIGVTSFGRSVKDVNISIFLGHNQRGRELMIFATFR